MASVLDGKYVDVESVKMEEEDEEYVDEDEGLLNARASSAAPYDLLLVSSWSGYLGETSRRVS